MLMRATPAEARAVLRAMRTVAASLSDPDRATLIGAHTYVFRDAGARDPDALPPIAPAEFAGALPDSDQRDHAVQFLTVMAMVDGTIDEAKIARVVAFADALGIREAYVRDLSELGKRHLDWVSLDVKRRNLRSITGHDVDLDEDAWLLPYRGADADPALVARYEALGGLPAGTFGRTFFDFYRTWEFPFPGDPRSANEEFASPHDSTHVLSGYDPSRRAASCSCRRSRRACIPPTPWRGTSCR
jgi:hypothetical protein